MTTTSHALTTTTSSFSRSNKHHSTNSLPLEGVRCDGPSEGKSVSYNNLMDVDHWKHAVKGDTPLPSIRLCGKSIQLKPRQTIYICIFSFASMFLIAYLYSRGTVYSSAHVIDYRDHKFRVGPKGERTMKIAIISDLDTKSKIGSHSKWKSILSKGVLSLFPNGSVSVGWNQEQEGTVTLHSSYARGDRGMELSELVRFNGRLLSVDDRTGLVYIIEGSSAIPWVLLVDGDGHKEKGFKGEWMAVKDSHLYVGSLGKPWSNGATVINHDPQWVKVVDSEGRVQHVNWLTYYDKMREVAHIKDPGYIIHEAAVWSDVRRRWYFLPRRASTEGYDDKEDERRATNLLFSADETFTDVTVTKLGVRHPTHGFSSFKFIPGTQDRYIVALKSEEDKDRIGTYIVAFDIVTGRELMKESYIGPFKYEGIEFI